MGVVKANQLTVNDIEAVVARLPASYQSEQQAHERELARVAEYHELSAQEALKGGNSTTVMPEEIERRVRDSDVRLHRAKRTVFDAANRQTLEPDLHQERDAIRTALSALLARAGVARDKYDIVRAAARSHGAPMPSAVLSNDDVWALQVMLARLEAVDRPVTTQRPARMGVAGILARVLGRA
jgi:hypothetical protein